MQRMSLQVESTPALSNVAQQLMKASVYCVSSQRAHWLCGIVLAKIGVNQCVAVPSTVQRSRLQVDRERTLSDDAQEHMKDRQARTQQRSAACRRRRTWP